MKYMNKTNTAIKNKKRILSVVLIFSIISSILMPMNLLNVKAAGDPAVKEVPEFNEGWKWAVNITEDGFADDGNSAGTPLAEITDFKKDWSYKRNVTEDSLADITDINTWAKGNIPIGYAGSSGSITQFIANNNGTDLDSLSLTNAANLVLQKEINLTSAELDDYKGFFMDAQMDDGAVVFVNGTEAVRFNANKPNADGSSGKFLFGYESRYEIPNPLEQPQKTKHEKFFISEDLFNPGSNVITIGVLNHVATSDILFDGMLFGIPNEFEDATPAGTTTNYNDEWLWVKNFPGTNQWLENDFIAADIGAAYESNSWRIGPSGIGHANNDTVNNANNINAGFTRDDIKTVVPITGNTAGTGYTSVLNTRDAEHTPVHNVYLRRVINVDKDSITNGSTGDNTGTLKMTVKHMRRFTVYLNGSPVLTETSTAVDNNILREKSVDINIADLNDGINIISADSHFINAGPNASPTGTSSTSIYFNMEFPILYDNSVPPPDPPALGDLVNNFQPADLGWNNTTADLPVGNAPESTSVLLYINSNNGTVTGTSGNTRNLVLQKEIEFTETELAGFSGFTMDAIVDDGAAVFINGQEAVRFNAETAAAGTGGKRVFGYQNTYETADPIALPGRSNYEKHFISKEFFKSGKNNITIAVLNHAETNDDILFDGMLYTIDNGYNDLTPAGEDFDYGSEWLWIKNNPGSLSWNKWQSSEFIGVEAANPDLENYASNSWRVNRAAFGYWTDGGAMSESQLTTKIPIVIVPGSPPRPSLLADAAHTNVDNIYLRRVFHIDKTQLASDGITTVSLTVKHNRNIYVYSNGSEVFKFIAPAGAFDTLREQTPITIPVDSLDEGRNVISVRMENTSANSTNMFFDAKLVYGIEFPGKSFVMSPGTDESKMGFTWFTPNDVTNAAVQIAAVDEYQANEGFESKDIVQGANANLDSRWNTSGDRFNGTFNSSWRKNTVTVTGLESETEYIYRYGDDINDLWSKTYTFTSGKSEDSLSNEDGNKILFLGDPTVRDNTKDSFHDTLNKAAEKNPDAKFILTSGDNADDQGRHYEMLKDSRHFNNLPFVTTIGNHDTGAQEDHFLTPNKTEWGKTTRWNDGKQWGANYYFSYGNTLYIMLNSMADPAQDAQINSFTDQNLQEHKNTIIEAQKDYPNAKWTVVVSHFDLYGAGPHAGGGTTQGFPYWRQIPAMRDKLIAVYEELGVDVVLNGHEHLYSRSFLMKDKQPQLNQYITNTNGEIVNPKGILHITASCSSSARFYDEYDKYSPSESVNWVDKIVNVHTPQFIELEITDNKFTITNYRADTLAELDTITLRKDECYSVTYAPNGSTGGTAPDETPKVAGDTFTAKANAFTAPQGTLFDSWNTESGGEGTRYISGETITMPEKELTLHAQWKIIEPIEHTVTLKSGDGAGSDITVNEKTADGGTYIIPAKPESFTAPDEKEFDGWKLGGDASDKVYKAGESITNVTSDIVLTAVWKAVTGDITFKVTFHADGGLPAPSEQMIGAGEKITRPPAMEKTGFTFDDWYKESTFTTKWDFDDDVVTAETQLYAKWIPEQEITAFKVTFHADGGLPAPSEQMIGAGEKITRPPAMEKTGFTFDDWYKESTFATKWDFDDDVVTADTQLYAKWNAVPQTIRHHVRFMDNISNKRIGGIREINHNTIISAAQRAKAPAKKGYTFVGWYTKRTGGSVFKFTARITGSTDIYARYIKNPARPSRFRSSVKRKRITLAWRKVSGVRFEIYQRNGSKGKWKRVSTTKAGASSWRKSLKKGKYQFKVRMVRVVNKVAVRGPFTTAKRANVR